MATASNIATRALYRMGVLAPEQSVPTNKLNQMTTALTALHAQWVDRGAIRWPLTSIPVEVEESLVTILSNHMAEDFGISTERAQRIAAKLPQAWADLYAYDQVPYDGSQEACYF